jgi:hypothetical protein
MREKQVDEVQEAVEEQAEEEQAVEAQEEDVQQVQLLLLYLEPEPHQCRVQASQR